MKTRKVSLQLSETPVTYQLFCLEQVFPVILTTGKGNMKLNEACVISLWFCQVSNSLQLGRPNSKMKHVSSPNCSFQDVYSRRLWQLVKAVCTSMRQWSTSPLFCVLAKYSKRLHLGRPVGQKDCMSVKHLSHPNVLFRTGIL